jgi:hypothetical protein
VISDTEIRSTGLRALINALGEVQAEKFIALIQRQPFDYTEWQRSLWPDKSVDEISAAAMDARNRPPQP